MDEPDFTIGVEEEYLLVDKQTRALAVVPDAMMKECEAALGGQVSPEFLQCQIEVGTGICRTAGEAFDDLAHLRRTIRDCAASFGLTPIAASCHPWADWKKQHHTDKQRYNQLRRDLGGVGRRMLICGMHVHVGLNDDALRADLMGQLSYFLPHLLALSVSSPFWQGEDTGLASYRISIFDNLPRTGLPPLLDSWDAYERSVTALVDLGVIEDASKIWWDLRPSAAFPTLETRICDVPPRLSHTIGLAALVQCLCRMLWRLRVKNQRWRRYDAVLVRENRWRAQRYGTGKGLIDFGRGEIVPFADLFDELLELVAEDAGVLQAVQALDGLRPILTEGTSSDRQRAVYAATEGSNGDKMNAVIDHLIDEFSRDL
ncbi:carboxylate-amine ligase [Thalassorhabdomicrobium marinisediminis]|uniref:Putative glutamate--cysteine ligase 2 n=1 Tax=Thalassorhabdomicrobium marinisediminis TaxID=2170577 RepID=A0A2T7G1M3_9RHOB|nr:carboxylate-amine ligase [Thalassorhabdomicrobium marinisediminis]PVA08288.1 carboxylate-amine ligase [Thalassorhabdomicrobium marinisediminis]